MYDWRYVVILSKLANLGQGEEAVSSPLMAVCAWASACFSLYHAVAWAPAGGCTCTPLEFENDDIICCFQAKYPEHFRSRLRRSHYICLKSSKTTKIRQKLPYFDFGARDEVLALMQLEKIDVYVKKIFDKCTPLGKFFVHPSRIIMCTPLKFVLPAPML